MAYSARSPNFVVSRFLLRSFYIITLLQRPISWFLHKVGFTESDDDSPPQLQPMTPLVIVPVDLIRKILPAVKFEDFVIDKSKSSRNTNQEEVEEDDDNRCIICLCRFKRQDEVRGLKECCHVFHKSCLDSWMDRNNNSCPLCRAPFISEHDSLTLLKYSLY